MNSSDYVIAAICGCFMRESHINPGIWESLIVCDWDYQYEYTHRGGYGLAQWTNVGTNHGRLWNLYQYATNNGYSMTDGNGQLAFMVNEGYWTSSNVNRLGYTSLSEFLNSDSTSIDDLVFDFLSCYEGVPYNALSERQNNAKKVYNYIQEHKLDGTSWSWVAANRYLSESERMNNAMCVWSYLSSGIVPPTPPTPPTPEGSKLPIWLLFKIREGGFRNNERAF